MIKAIKSTKSVNWHRAISLAMLPIFVLAASPLPAAIALSPRARVAPNIPPEKSPVTPKTGPRSVKLLTPKLSFTADPSDTELSMAPILLEPLIPMSGQSIKGENRALADALLAFRAKTDPEDVSDITGFIAKFPESRWRAALELNLGLRRWETGYLSEALEYFKSSWERAKNEKGYNQKQLADRAIAQLLLDDARLGQTEELKKYLSEISNRPLHGSNEELVGCAKEGLTKMEHEPAKAFKCGPYAVNSLLHRGKSAKMESFVDTYPSTKQGTSLAQVNDLAQKMGLQYQMAKRQPGAPFVVPSIMHWKVGHFAAITSQDRNRFQLNDPTFDAASNMWFTAKALDSESDGYFLVPAGTLPSGWQPVSKTEAQSVWGRGGASGKAPGDSGGPCGTGGGGGDGGG